MSLKETAQIALASLTLNACVAQQAPMTLSESFERYREDQAREDERQRVAEDISARTMALFRLEPKIEAPREEPYDCNAYLNDRRLQTFPADDKILAAHEYKRSEVTIIEWGTVGSRVICGSYDSSKSDREIEQDKTLLVAQAVAKYAYAVCGGNGWKYAIPIGKTNWRTRDGDLVQVKDMKYREVRKDGWGSTVPMQFALTDLDVTCEAIPYGKYPTRAAEAAPNFSELDSWPTDPANLMRTSCGEGFVDALRDCQLQKGRIGGYFLPQKCIDSATDALGQCLPKELESGELSLDDCVISDQLYGKICENVYMSGSQDAGCKSTVKALVDRSIDRCKDAAL